MYALAVIVLVLLIDFMKWRQLILIVVPTFFAVGISPFIGFELGVSLTSEWLAAICLFVSLTISACLDYRNFSHVIFSLIPPVVGALMMLGALGILNVDLNPANLIVLPLVLGIAC